MIPTEETEVTDGGKKIRRSATYQAFLTSVLEEGRWSTSRSDRFTPGERPHHTHCLGRWATEVLEKRRISKSCQESNHHSLVVRPVAYSLILPSSFERILGLYHRIPTSSRNGQLHSTLQAYRTHHRTHIFTSPTQTCDIIYTDQLLLS